LIAGIDSAEHRKTILIYLQSQGYQSTIITFFIAFTPFTQLTVKLFALKIGVGRIIEIDPVNQRMILLQIASEPGLYLRFMLQD